MLSIYDPNARQGYVVVDATRGVIGGTLRLPSTVAKPLEQEKPLKGARLPSFSDNPQDFIRDVESLVGTKIE